MSDNKDDSGLVSILRIVVQKIIENPDSPYVAVPLALCLVFLLVYIPTRESLTLYAAIGFGLVTILADCVGRIQNRQVEPVRLHEDAVAEEAPAYLKRASSKSEDLRKQGKVDAANIVLEKSSKALYDELARLADGYEDVRNSKPSGPNRTAQFNELVGQIQNIARRTTLATEEVKVYLESKVPGRRIIGLAIAEEHPNNTYFHDTLKIVADSASGFEQYHALRVIEKLISYLSQEQRKDLKAKLETQMSGGRGNWITPETPNRWNLATKILASLASLAS